VARTIPRPGLTGFAVFSPVLSGGASLGENGDVLRHITESFGWSAIRSEELSWRSKLRSLLRLLRAGPGGRVSLPLSMVAFVFFSRQPLLIRAYAVGGGTVEARSAPKNRPPKLLENSPPSGSRTASHINRFVSIAERAAQQAWSASSLRSDPCASFVSSSILSPSRLSFVLLDAHTAFPKQDRALCISLSRLLAPTLSPMWFPINFTAPTPGGGENAPVPT